MALREERLQRVSERMMNAQRLAETLLESRDRLRVGGLLAEVGDGALEKIVDFRRVAALLGDSIHEVAEIRGRRDICVTTALAVEGVQQRDLPQRVHLALAASGENNLRFVEQVEFSGEGTAGSQGAARGGLQLSKLPRHPDNDQARLGKPDLAKQNARRLVHVTRAAR